MPKEVVIIRFEGFLEKYFGWEVITEIKDSHATVVKHGNEKILLYDNIIYSKLKDNSLYTHSYWDYFIPLPALYENPKILIIGLGGGTIPYQINKLFGSKADIDVVELDKNMLKIADLFLPEKLNANIIIEDGYLYVQKFKNKYDIIMMDPFIRDNIPDQFFESKFIENVNNALKPEGILAINYVFSAIGMIRQRDFKAKLSKFFSIYTINYSFMSGNRIFICPKSLKKKQIVEKLYRDFPKDKENSFILKAYKKMG
jgi:spermidine synthase